MTRASFVTSALGLALLAGPLPASADGGEQGLPLRYQERPLTLPWGDLSLDAAYSQDQVDVPMGMQTSTHLEIGATHGITDDLQVHAVVLPLEYGRPMLGATYRFLSGGLELGASAFAVIPVQERTAFGIRLAVPLLVRIGTVARLDTGIASNLSFGGDGSTSTTEVPVALTLQLIRWMFVGVVTGIYWSKNEYGQSTAFPLGLLWGYAIPGSNGQPLVDVIARFERLAMSAGPYDRETMIFTLRVHVHLSLCGGSSSPTSSTASSTHPGAATTSR